MRKLGAKGTNYGVDPRIGEFMAGPAAGIPKALEGGVELGQQAYEGVANSNLDLNKVAGGLNKVVGGVFQSAGPVGAIAAPGGEALAVVVPAMIAQTNMQKAAEYMGATPEMSELAGNVAGVVTGGLVHAKLHPVVERFGVAMNAHTAAEQEYTMRSRELETARGQAAEMQSRAVDTASKETQGQAKPADTDAARTAASEAAKNVGNAQKAFDAASKRKADAQITVEKLGRQITKSAEKNKAEEYESKASEQKKASDLFQKAVPSKGANRYTPEDEEIARAHMEAAKASGTKITDLATAHEALENARQGIEDKLDPYVEKYKNEPLTSKAEDSPKVKVAQKLAEMAKVDGNFDNAMDALSDFNITDPTVGEAREMITKLNNYQRSAMKGANNWDIHNMIETNPDFAARFFMADELRDALHNNLEGHGVEGSRAARLETKSLVNVRDAIGAQLRANRGGTTVRGSGTQNAMRLLVGKLVGKSIKGAGIAAGAEMGGVPGAIAGGAVGEMIGQPVEDFLAPRDQTRDAHIEQSLKYKGTNRKPVEIKGTGTPAVIPTEAIPPAVKQGPSSVELTPRENTDLHAELAAHYGESNLEDSSYKELEQDLREDVARKNRSGVELDPAEKTLLTKILKADSADRALQQAAGKPSTEVKIEPTKEKELLQAADQRASEGEATKLNPTLVSLGRGDESALVSHSPAMKAHSPAMVIPGLQEGLTSEDGHLEEWAHNAVGAVDGLEPVEIRSDLHPKSEKGAGATSVFNAAAIRNPDGSLNVPELARQEVQWLTQKMAGPASHEVFKGMTRDDIKTSPANRSDFRQARAIIREVHPDFTPSQVEQVIDLAYDRAHELLTKPHIADRIRANAAVREDGLAQTLHASHGRVNQFAEDIRNAHNEYTGTDNRPDGGGADEGGEKAAAGEPEGKKDAGEGKVGREPGASKAAGKSAEAGGGTVEGSDISKKIPERSTGKPEVDESIRAGGGVPGGMQKGFEYKDKATGETRQYPDMAYVHEPESGTSLNFPMDQITPEFVKERLAEKRAEYAAAEAKPEESKIGKEEEYHPDLQAVADKFGTSTDPAGVKRGASFIAPDGKFIHLGATEHPVAIESSTGRTGDAEAIGEKMTRSIGPEDSRIGFIKDTGAIRTRFRSSIAGKELVASVPAGGVTEEQISALRQAVGQGLGRNGNLLMEVGEPGGKSATKEFASPRDVEPMLREIGAHPEQAGKGGFQEVPTQEMPREDLTKAYKMLADGKIGKNLLTGIVNGDPEDVAVFRMLDRHPDGGFTVNPHTGEVPNDGYMVETANKDKVFDHPPTAKEYQNFIKDNRATLDADPSLHIGGWVNPDGKYTVALSSRVPDLATATELGKSHNQISIFDVAKGKEIPTGGTGEALKPEAVEQSQIAKDRVSTRQPAGKDSTENPLVGAPLEIGRDTIAKAPEKLQAKFAGTVRNYPGVKIPDSIKSPAKVMDKFVSHVKDNLKFLYNQVDPAKRAQTGKWYESANKLAKGMAADNNITEQQAAATIATQSPQKDWDMNVSLARRITDINSKQQDTVTTPEMIQKGRDIVKNTGANEDLGKVIDYLQGKKLSDLKGESGAEKYDRAAWIRLYDEAHNPRDFHSIDPGTGENGELRTNANGAPSKIAWGSLPQIENALSVLEDGSRENISDKLGAQHKVRNFYNNIIDPTNPNDVTIDTHAVAAGLMQPLSGNSEEVTHNFGGAGKHTGTGISGTYPLYADAYRQAASELGIKARELQSIVWEHVREMFPADWKSPENQKLVKDVWQKYSDGKQTLDNTRQQILKISEGAKKQIADARAEAQAKAAAKETKAKKPVDKQTEMVYSGGMSGLGGK